MAAGLWGLDAVSIKRDIEETSCPTISGHGPKMDWRGLAACKISFAEVQHYYHPC